MTTQSIVKHHSELADLIAGKRILMLNSLGKESVLALTWLCEFAHVESVVSLTYRFFAEHPKDAVYLQYLRRRFPMVDFRFEVSPSECSRVLQGVFQTPLDAMSFNGEDFDTFDMQLMTEDLRVEFGCDYACFGVSRYESFDRANWFHKNGIFDENTKQIFPLGMMSKDQVMSLIRATGIRLHPSYKLAKSSLDRPNYYKMRAWFLADPDYERRMFEVYPLLRLDKYRWEQMIERKND